MARLTVSPLFLVSEDCSPRFLVRSRIDELPAHLLGDVAAKEDLQIWDRLQSTVIDALAVLRTGVIGVLLDVRREVGDFDNLVIRQQSLRQCHGIQPARPGARQAP